MIPPIFGYAKASIAVTALLGSTTTRFWPFGEAPQPGQDGYALPYAVWQLVSGDANEFIGDLSDADSSLIQIDVWGATESSARAVMIALRNAIEPHQNGGSTTYNGEDRDKSTGLYWASFSVRFWKDR